MKIAVLANSRLAVPTIIQLAQAQLINTIIIPNIVHEGTDELIMLAQNLGLGIQKIEKEHCTAQLSSCLHQIQADVAMVFTFPYILSKDVLEIPKMGFYNFHFALLPEYRGADPIFWQIRNRETHGGVSVHQMTTEMDKGPLVHIEKTAIDSEDTYGMHMSKVAYAGIPATQQLINALQQNPVPTKAQDEKQAKYYPKAGFKDVSIQWDAPAAEIKALIKACNPWNKGAYTQIRGNSLRIVDAKISVHTDTEKKPGSILASDDELLVLCGDQKCLSIQIIHIPEGFITGKQFMEMGFKNPECFH